MLRSRRVEAKGELLYQEPRFVPWVYAFMRTASPVYLRVVERIDRMHVRGIDRLIGAYQEFYGASARLLIAFRHASVHDPPVMTHLLCRLLPRAARRSHRRLGGLPHAHFLYGRGVTLWAGGAAAFLIPRIGALSVMNRRSDSRGLAAIRRCLLEGPFPMALAPEGQVSYHNHWLGPMETGVARLGRWCLEELGRRGRTEEVLILPLAIHYRYPRRPREILERIVERTAALAGLEVPPGSDHERLVGMTAQLVARMEGLYRRFYDREGIIDGGGSLERRIERLCEAALRVAERFMDLPSKGDLLPRVFTVRQKGWDYLFRGDLGPRGTTSALDRVLAARLADEAYLQLRHNELVDLLEYVHTDYIGVDASVNRLIEYALNLADLVNRLMGGDISSRYSPPHKTVEIRVGEPLRLRQRDGGLAGRPREHAEGILMDLRARFEELSREQASPAESP